MWFEKGIKAALHQQSSCRSRFYGCLSGKKTDHNHTWSRFPTFLHTYAYGHTAAHKDHAGNYVLPSVEVKQPERYVCEGNT